MRLRPHRRPLPALAAVVLVASTLTVVGPPAFASSQHPTLIGPTETLSTAAAVAAEAPDTGTPSSEDIVLSIIKAKEEIDRENAAFLAAEKAKIDAQQLSGELALEAADQAELLRRAEELDAKIKALVDAALSEHGPLSPKYLEQLRASVAATAAKEQTKLDLDAVQALKAGADDAALEAEKAKARAAIAARIAKAKADALAQLLKGEKCIWAGDANSPTWEEPTNWLACNDSFPGVNQTAIFAGQPAQQSVAAPLGSVTAIQIDSPGYSFSGSLITVGTLSVNAASNFDLVQRVNLVASGPAMLGAADIGATSAIPVLTVEAVRGADFIPAPRVSVAAASTLTTDLRASGALELRLDGEGTLSLSSARFGIITTIGGALSVNYTGAADPVKPNTGMLKITDAASLAITDDATLRSLFILQPSPDATRPALSAGDNTVTITNQLTVQSPAHIDGGRGTGTLTLDGGAALAGNALTLTGSTSLGMTGQLRNTSDADIVVHSTNDGSGSTAGSLAISEPQTGLHSPIRVSGAGSSLSYSGPAATSPLGTGALSLSDGATLHLAGSATQFDSPVHLNAASIVAGDTAAAVTVTQLWLDGPGTLTGGATTSGTLGSFELSELHGAGPLQLGSAGARPTVALLGSPVSTATNATTVESAVVTLAGERVVPGDLTVRSGSVTVMAEADGNAIADSALVTLNPSDAGAAASATRLRLEASEKFAALAGSGGQLDFAPSGMNSPTTLEVKGTSNTIFAGHAAGTGRLLHSGTGALDLTSATAWSPTVAIEATNGRIGVNAPLASSDVTISGSAVLGGNGTVGSITSAGARVAPGNSPGCLTVAGAMTGTATLSMEIGGGAPCTGYDQIHAQSINLTGLNLQLSFVNGYAPTVGTTFALLRADASVTFPTQTVTANGFTLTLSAVGSRVAAEVTAVPVGTTPTTSPTTTPPSTTPSSTVTSGTSSSFTPQATAAPRGAAANGPSTLASTGVNDALPVAAVALLALMLGLGLRARRRSIR